MEIIKTKLRCYNTHIQTTNLATRYTYEIKNVAFFNGKFTCEVFEKILAVFGQDKAGS